MAVYRSHKKGGFLVFRGVLMKNIKEIKKDLEQINEKNISWNKGVCKACTLCCYFPNNKFGLDYAPTFIQDEHRIIINKYKDAKCCFKPLEINNAMRVIPNKSKLKQNSLVCPFLDEKRYLCRIYEDRPFDCAFSMFFLCRKGEKVYLTLAREDCCKTINMMKESGRFDRWIRTLVAFVKKNKELFLHHPELIFSYDLLKRGTKDSGLVFLRQISFLN